MLYMVVDPYFVYLDPNQVSRKEFRVFLNRLGIWHDTIRDFEIEFGMTRVCRRAFFEFIKVAFDENVLKELLYRFPVSGIKYEDVVKMYIPFINRLLGETPLDILLEKLQTDRMVWETKKIFVNPADYIYRQKSEAIQNAFLEMLGTVVFARKNRIVPLSEFKQLGLLSVASQPETWIKETDQRILVRIDFTWFMSNDNEMISEEATILDDFEVYVLPNQLKQATKEFSRVLDAVQAAAEAHPETLFVSDMALDSALHCGYRNPKFIYDLLDGLAMIWLPIYISTGGNTDEANRAFQNRLHKPITNDESDPVKNDPQKRKDYIVAYDDKDIFCGRHIKLGTGPDPARINFQVTQLSTGEYKIIIARAGEHGSNTLN